MQEELARVLPDGTYRLTPQSHSTMCLDTYNKGEIGEVQLHNSWNGNNQKWDLT